MWTLLALTAFATDSGIQRLYDRELSCDFQVDPPPDARSCVEGVRSVPPDDERPTWGIAIAPPGKLYFSMHTADIDWGHVYRIDTPRAFDPILLSVGLTKEGKACPNERLFYLHSLSERGGITKQVCVGFDWNGHGEVLLESHRKLPNDMWVPVWAWIPDDPEKAANARDWFLVQMWVSSTGDAPERPPQFPYVSTDVIRAWVPKPLPIRKRYELLGPEPEPEPEESADGEGDAKPSE
ncbi:MAG: hypothetical protein R3F61_35410 [Myxococcota bacterium]